MRRLALIVGAAVAASVAAGLVASGPAARRTGLARFDWPEGTRWRYALEWTTTTHALFEQQPLDGRMDLACDVVVTSYGPRGGVTVLGVALEHLRRHELEVLGKNVFPDAATAERALEGAEALMEVDARGRVQAIRYPAAAQPLFVHVIQELVGEAQVTLPEAPQAAWTALEAGPQARVEQRYHVDARDGLTLHREAGRLDGVTGADHGFMDGANAEHHGTATVVLDPAGHVRALDAESTTRVTGRSELAATSRFHLTRSAIEEVDRTHPPGGDEVAIQTRHPGELTATLSREDMDHKFAGDLTAGNVAGTIDAYAQGIGMGPQWIGRATAFVRVHPDFVPVLRARFTAGNGRARELVFDVLSGAGSREAQAALRDLIQTPEATADRDLYAALLQRFSFVWSPEAETVDLLARLHEDARAQGDRLIAHASVYALGAAVGHRGDHAGHARLVAELDASGEAEDRTALLAALGNAGLREGRDPVAARAGDADDEVRAQVATSLRRWDDAASHAVLLRLLGDGETAVAKCALATLGDLKLTPDEVGRVADLIEAGAITGMADATLVGFAQRHHEAPGAAVRILRAVKDRARDRPDVGRQAELALQTFAAR